jgi:uncharacterized protein
MQCPNPSCQSVCSQQDAKPELMMSERSGIEIDYCPRCRGIWLDRGELDKLLEKAAREFEAGAPPRRDSIQQQDQYSHYEKPRHDSYKKHDYEKHKHSGSYKKKSLLSELFDF